MSATTIMPIYIYQANSITLTVTNIRSITVSQICQYSNMNSLSLSSNELYAKANQETYICYYTHIFIWKLIPTLYEINIYEDSRPNQDQIKPEILIGLICGISGGLLIISMIIVTIFRKPKTIFDYHLMFHDSESNSEDEQSKEEAHTNIIDNPLFNEHNVDDPFQNDFVIS